MYEISALARQYAPWSISKAEVAETCLAQFEHKYILRTKADEVTSATVGTCAHSVLEFRVGGMSKDDAVKLALEKTPLTTNEMEELQSFYDQMEDFLQRWDGFCKREGVTEPLLEVEWGFTAEFKPCGFKAPDVYFRGKVDLGAVTRDGDLVVVDHKSGVAKDIHKDNKKKRQLNSYAVLAAACVPNLGGVRGGIHFLRGNPDLRLQWLDYIPVDKIRKLYVPWLYSYLNSAAENLVPPFDAKPKLRWPCEWCGYKAACPAYNEMMLAAQI